MRITIDDRYDPDTTHQIRTIVRHAHTHTGHTTTSADVEVHVKAVAERTVWILPCTTKPPCGTQLDIRPDRPQAWPAVRTTTGIHRAHVLTTRRRARQIADRHHQPHNQILRWNDLRPTKFTGYAYKGVPDLARTDSRTRWLTTLKLPLHLTNNLYPYNHTYHRAKTAGTTTVHCWHQHLLHLAAHEARHTTQFIHEQPTSEVDAEQHAQHLLATTAHPCPWCTPPNP